MRKELLCLILLTGCLFSCSLKRTDSLNTFEDILIKSKTYHKQLTVIVTDGTPLKLKNNSDKIVVCDFFTGFNIDANRIFSFQHYPALISVEEGFIKFVSDDSVLVRDYIQESSTLSYSPKDSFLEYYYESGEDLIELLNKILNLRYRLNGELTLDQQVELDSWFINRYVDDYAYTLYLLYLLEKRIGITDENNAYLAKVLSSSEFISSPLYHMLFRELNRMNSKNVLPILRLSDKQIDFGDISCSTHIKKTLKAFNMGNNLVTIFRPVVSCPCIKVYYPETIMPQDSAEFTIVMDSTGTEGYFEKEIIITSNAKNGTIVIPVRGTIIK